MHILSIRREHLDEVYKIEKSSFSMPWTLDAFKEILESDTIQGLVAVLQPQEVVGYVVFCEVVEELQILNIAVHPSHRNKKYGSAILTHLHAHARASGRTESYLEVREGNEEALALYLKFGYQPYTRRPRYYSDTGEDAILMKADLRKKI